jgi:multidrug efflux pump subunit AcrA (membrane-fusion protein)
MFIIYRLFDNFYSKYFPDLGVVFLILTLTQIFRKKARTAIRVGKLFYLDKKDLVKSPRSRLPMAVIGALLLLFLLVPWSRRTIRADALLKPVSEVQLAATQDGRVAEVLVREGDTVRQGQPLFRVTSSAADEELSRRTVERERFAKRSSGSREAGNAAGVFQATQQGSSAEAALRSSEIRHEGLLIRSPIAGRVLTPRTEDLAGRFVTAGFPLARVGDCRRMVAPLPVSERLLEYLKPGAPVRAQIDTSPMRSWPGRVSMVSPATLEQPVTAQANVERLAPSRRPDQFVALAVFDNTDGSLLPGAQARVKIRSNRESYGSRAWSVVWRRLRTIVW